MFVRKMCLFLVSTCVVFGGIVQPTLVCPPVITPDSVRVDPNCAGLLKTITVTAGASTWMAWGNDNPVTKDSTPIETGDGDYNDAVVEVDISSTHDVTMFWVASDAAWANGVSAMDSSIVSASSKGPVDIGTFSVGSEIVLALHASDGNTYFSGDPSRNCGYSHWYVQDPVVVPEPSYMLLTGLLLLGVGISKRRK